MTDKHYPPEFWQWAARLTETWEFNGSYNFNDLIESKHTDSAFSTNGLEKDIEAVESFTYQAIDRLLDLGYNYKINNFLLTIGKDSITKTFDMRDYPTKTAARLAALHWIWERSK